MCFSVTAAFSFSICHPFFNKIKRQYNGKYCQTDSDAKLTVDEHVTLPHIYHQPMNDSPEF